MVEMVETSNGIIQTKAKSQPILICLFLSTISQPPYLINKLRPAKASASLSENNRNYQFILSYLSKKRNKKGSAPGRYGTQKRRNKISFSREDATSSREPQEDPDRIQRCTGHVQPACHASAEADMRRGFRAEADD